MQKPFPLLAALLLGAIMTSCQTTYEAGAPEGRLDVIAHRGASAYAPENTLAAFRLAHEMDADWFELDCTLTADEQVVVVHDCDFARTTGLEQAVRMTDMETIRTLDAGAWFSEAFAGEPVPTLGETLDFAQGRIGVYIEIKSCTNDDQLHKRLMQAVEGQERLTPALRSELMTLVSRDGTDNLALTRAVIREVRARDMARQVVIQSFSPVVCLIALSEAPEIRTEMLGSDSEDHPERWPMLVAFAKLIRADGFNAHHASLTPARIDDFHRSGMTVAAWTVDEPVVIQRIAAWGVDGIITNKPDLAHAVQAGGDFVMEGNTVALSTSPGLVNRPNAM